MNLSSTIVLRDGRQIKTLEEAVALLEQLPKTRQLKPLWQKTCEMLLQANKTKRKIDMQHATAQLCRALQAEGWLI